MIGRLQGTLLEKHPPAILIDVQGVGYELEASMSTFYHLPECGETITLHTHMVVREDAQLLYGFYSLSERQMFRNLIKISGVGPKLALTILSGMSAEDFSRCIMDGDSKALTRLPGVGKKTAERLVIELKDRLEKDDTLTLAATNGTTEKIERQANPVNDAVSALISLGYKAQQASQMIRDLDVEDRTTEEIIRAALQAGGK
ncbi:MAG: Holliday junction branch migration protein RuvA [Gammaproteobacteria bacterium]|nr:Holliday junction branch migration protein RuvA [Gammaproteobacteria bacterium]NNJ49749.1 Holliday junction branch migration protein RuvA [Gammaproteobacteria bacterium]